MNSVCVEARRTMVRINTTSNTLTLPGPIADDFVACRGVVLSRAAPHCDLLRFRPVSLPIFRFLQSTEHRDFSPKQFSFFFSRTTVSGVAISSLRRERFRGFLPFLRNAFFWCWIGFRSCSSFFLLLFLLILWFFLWREGGIFVDGVNVCVPLDCVG
jgi:hypothetical protein